VSKSTRQAAFLFLTLAIAMVLIVCPFMAGVAYAGGARGDDWEELYGDWFDNFNPERFRDEDGKSLTWFEKTVARGMYSLLKAVVKGLNLEPIEAVVFKRPVGGEYPEPLFRPYGGFPEVGGVYYASEWENVIKPAHGFFKNVSFSILLISVLLGGVSIALKSGNPIERARVKEMFFNWIVTAVMIGAMLTLTVIAFDLNSRLVVAVEGIIRQSLNIQGGSYPTLKLAESLTTGSWFFTFLSFAGFIVLTVFFNVLYLLRKLIISILLVVGPLVVLAWGRGRQMSLYLWLSELVSNIFMQAAHAIAFALYLLLVTI